MYGIGLKALSSLCKEQNQSEWRLAKLALEMFKPLEAPIFTWVEHHLKEFHALPNIETLNSKFPEMKQIDTVEPPAYYVKILENSFFHDQLNRANIESQNILKDDPNANQKAVDRLQETLNQIRRQKYRQKLMDLGKEGSKLVVQQYHGIGVEDVVASFGWPYLDGQTGGLLGGEVVSFVGRPATGKSWLTLYTAIQNWRLGRNVLFVSMEMSPLSIAQRVAAMYTNCPISQLKNSAFSSHTYSGFSLKIKGMSAEKGKFIVVDGNLAATPDDVYAIADEMECSVVIIDGAYLLRHKNARLNRYERVAENAELIKRYGSDLGAASFCSWQFNRDATKKSKTSGKQEANLEDIGYSDAIGQISSVALGLMQEETVETMYQRLIRVMKGRDGQVGEFSIHWDFDVMDFNQVKSDDSVQDGEFAWT